MGIMNIQGEEQCSRMFCIILTTEAFIPKSLSGTCGIGEQLLENTELGNPDHISRFTHHVL